MMQLNPKYKYMSKRKILKEFNDIRYNRINKFDIINKYTILRDGIEFILNNNTANDAPYHNFSHLLDTVNYCNFLYKYSSNIKKDNLKLEMLLLSALFHDFNHSQGKEKDDVNIEMAIVGLKKFIDNEHKGRYSDPELFFISSLIRATTFPGCTIENIDLTEYKMIIRDADFMRVYDTNYIQFCFIGLKNESNCTYSQWADGQFGFLEKLFYYTYVGKMIHKKYKQTLWDEYNGIKNNIYK